MFVIAILLSFILMLVTYCGDADDAQFLGALGWFVLIIVLIAANITEAF